jgi:hypothetical protein
MDEQFTQPTPAPASIDDVLKDLRSFGIEEFEEVLTLTIDGKKLRLKLANVPVEADILAMLAVEEKKNYQFFQGIKLELLSRSITWINGVDIRSMSKKERLVNCPVNGVPCDIQVALRNVIQSWGLEVMQVLFKVLMVHSQTIENRLFDEFPDAAVLTNVERRYRERIERDLEEQTRQVLTEQVDELMSIDVPGDETDETN